MLLIFFSFNNLFTLFWQIESGSDLHFWAEQPSSVSQRVVQCCFEFMSLGASLRSHRQVHLPPT